MDKKRLIIGMSGASGAPLTVALLKQIKKHFPMVQTHLIVTKGAQMTLEQETSMTLKQLQELATVVHDNKQIGDTIASGSFKTMGMIVVPCSMKTLAGIVSGYSDNLLLRSCDVCLKERRKLVLVPRETPLSTLHLQNLYKASQFGAMIVPPMLTYYNNPTSLEECTQHIANRILSYFDLDLSTYEWDGIQV